ncbi:MAG TPA: hypothetical protein VI837_05945 [Blastocatellia bacterium]|nr:hypothetical protein [Blastocatellia bacterium]
MTKITKMTAVIILVLVTTLANSIPVGAQQPAAPVVGTWDAIKALPSRDELTVTLKDGSSQKGKLTDATDTALILSQGKKITEIRRDGIFQIYRSVPKSRSRATGTGAAVGAGLGVISGLVGDGSSGHGQGPGTAIAGVFVMAGVGALIGRGIAGGHERVLIYEARR